MDSYGDHSGAGSVRRLRRRPLEARRRRAGGGEVSPRRPPRRRGRDHRRLRPRTTRFAARRPDAAAVAIAIDDRIILPGFVDGPHPRAADPHPRPPSASSCSPGSRSGSSPRSGSTSIATTPRRARRRFLRRSARVGHDDDPGLHDGEADHDPGGLRGGRPAQLPRRHGRDRNRPERARLVASRVPTSSIATRRRSSRSGTGSDAPPTRSPRGSATARRRSCSPPASGSRRSTRIFTATPTSRRNPAEIRGVLALHTDLHRLPAGVREVRARRSEVHRRSRRLAHRRRVPAALDGGRPR